MLFNWFIPPSDINWNSCQHTESCRILNASRACHFTKRALCIVRSATPHSKLTCAMATQVVRFCLTETTSGICMEWAQWHWHTPTTPVIRTSHPIMPKCHTTCHGLLRTWLLIREGIFFIIEKYERNRNEKMESFNSLLYFLEPRKLF